MNNDAPLSEVELQRAFGSFPKGSLSAEFQPRVLAVLERQNPPRPATFRRTVRGCWLAIAAASVAVMAAVDWEAVEPSPAAVVIAGGGLLLCCSALVFLLRIARTRFMEGFWRALTG